MQAFCCGHNFAHPSTGVAALSDEHTEKTAHEIRFGESFPGHCIPFGARIFWKCLNPDINNETAKFKENAREGLFMGYHLHSGGRWSGDDLVLDTATYAKNPDGDLRHVHRVKDIIIPDGKFTFPVKD
eukprot:5529076-Pyramimonas_sp.AAC.1